MLAAASCTTAKRQDTPRVQPRRHGHPKCGSAGSGTVVGNEKERSADACRAAGEPRTHEPKARVGRRTSCRMIQHVGVRSAADGQRQIGWWLPGPGWGARSGAHRASGDCRWGRGFFPEWRKRSEIRPAGELHNSGNVLKTSEVPPLKGRIYDLGIVFQ